MGGEKYCCHSKAGNGKAASMYQEDYFNAGKY